MPSIRRQLQNLTLKIGRATARFDWLKEAFHLHAFIHFFLDRPVSEKEKKAITGSLRTDIIQDAIRTSKASGISQLHFYILLVESLGDIIAAEPIARQLSVMTDNAVIHWIVRRPFVDIITANPFVKDVIPVDSLSEGKDLCIKKASLTNIIVDCHLHMTFCTMSNRVFEKDFNRNLTVDTYYSVGNLLETFALAAGLPRISDAPIFHLQLSARSLVPDIQHYIVVHCHSQDCKRDWADAKWNDLVGQLLDCGWSVVEIGTLRTITKKHPNFHDRAGMRSIQDIACTIKFADGFIGVDSGFAHMANAFHTPSILLLGKFRTWTNYMPYSGEFAQSQNFKILRAPDGTYASAISAESVLRAASAIFKR